MQVESSDLIAYGLIPEFIGRFPVLVSLSALTEDQLIQVNIFDQIFNSLSEFEVNLTVKMQVATSYYCNFSTLLSFSLSPVIVRETPKLETNMIV